MDEFSMYVCPECKKVFKVKGNNKAVKCSQCSESLLDMGFSLEDWEKLSKEERAKLKKEHSTSLGSSIGKPEEGVSANQGYKEDKPKSSFFVQMDQNIPSSVSTTQSNEHFKPVKLRIDINAHIRDLKCSIQFKDKAYLVIHFKNLWYGRITAIKFRAVGYNSFNDIVKIKGKDYFYLVIQDIDVDKDGDSGELMALLPNPDMRRVELMESQICYSDGSVSSYETGVYRDFDLEEFMPGEMLEALRTRFGDKYTYKPVLFENGWMCSCGVYNGAQIMQCQRCGNTKEEIFRYADSIERHKLLKSFKDDYAKAEEDRKEKQAKSKARKKRNLIIFAASLILTIIAALIIRVVVLSGRSTFNSKDEMQKSVIGTYTNYRGGEAFSQLHITYNNAELKYSDGDNIPSTIYKWDYKNGRFKTFKNYYVLSNGNIKDADGTIFVRGGEMESSSSNPSSSSSSYSSSDTSWYDYAYKPISERSSYSTKSSSAPLSVYDKKVTSNGSYTICTGSVKNNGTRTYKFVEVKGAFKDSSGSVLDTDWTYAAGSEGLAPGESSTFRLSIDYNRDIKSCDVTILDYD